MKKKLWMIFGPLVVAAIVLLGLLFSPFKINRINKTTERQAATSLSPNVLKGEAIKKAALSHKEYVPFFGSSEFSRFDVTHPSVLATKYDRNYQPFLMGAPGTQSLTHYFQMQSINKELTNRKAIVVISPQWFVKKGTDPKAFSFYFSTLQAANFLLTQKGTYTEQVAAKRLLSMPSGHANDQVASALQRVADGKKITKFDRFYLKNLYHMARQEDRLFSSIRLSNNDEKVEKQAKDLPAKDDSKAIEKEAIRQGKEDTTNNDFGIKNDFYKRRLSKKINKFKNFEKDFNYTESPEFADFQMVLNQFAEDHTNVMFIIPPVNEKWAKYTGLSQSMLDGFSMKIKYQLQSQGFNNIVDLSQDGAKPYFMQDTIHLGWTGWLDVDKHIQPFIKDKQPKPNYKMDNKFYSHKWQFLNPDDLSSYK
ncbi:D-alanyl-lipoteichoic acid biosynthesis protein DltD [Pediococcus argentinicus]|nr:D-alanyl-lipoteichoic acid biosynthesis protein DltD [Pediococcus argentinicus]NKZ22845.1 D-alanyl-lipoteichoic acid biosynthesis protein DltD [Pediococcus argentinicus]GEP19932.1 D-alanyl-lipoteichoic acid biosynthesis protein DltD [Pediococcus argentinicus]